MLISAAEPSGEVELGLFISAAVQAAAAVIIAAFRVALWRSTSKLAQATEKNVELTEQIARLQSVGLAREAAKGAPSLIAGAGDRTVGNDAAVNFMRVENVGSSTAYEIEADTSWGTGRASSPILAGDKSKVQVQLPNEEWETRPDQDPIIHGFKFKDAQGIWWKQVPGEIPVRVEE